MINDLDENGGPYFEKHPIVGVHCLKKKPQGKSKHYQPVATFWLAGDHTTWDMATEYIARAGARSMLSSYFILCRDGRAGVSTVKLQQRVVSVLFKNLTCDVSSFVAPVCFWRPGINSHMIRLSTSDLSGTCCPSTALIVFCGGVSTLFPAPVACLWTLLWFITHNHYIPTRAIVTIVDNH